MAHVAFLAPPFPGHLNPMRALAAELAGRGHRASFLHMPDVASAVPPAFGFVPVGEGTHPPGTLPRVVARINGLTGLAGLGGVLRDVAAMTDMLCREAPARLRALGVDAIVGDQTEAAGGLVARHLRLPFVSVANALPINGEPGVPPPFTDWDYDPSDRGRRRNEGGYRVARWMMWRTRRVIARHAEAWGLGRLRTLEDCLSDRAQLSQMVRALDFPRAALPAGFHYTGPLREPAVGEMTLPEDRPLVFVTLGTLQGGRIGLFRAIAAACQGLGLRCVIAHGGRLTAREAATLPDPSLVFGFVPQRAVLNRAAVTITHGGLNTVLDSLAAGVPVVALPLAFEQAATAARLVHAGAGRALKPRPETAGFVPALVAAVSEVLSDPSYRTRAARLRDDIAASGGARAAADVIEAVLRDPIS